MKSLPTLPSCVRTLDDDEIKRLRQTRNDLPASPAECPTCHGAKSFIWWDDDSLPHEQRTVAEYACPCVDQFLLQRWLLKYGIEKQWAQARWHDLTALPPALMPQLHDYIGDIDYYVNQGTGLFLHGDNGAGKSMLAALIAKRVLSKGTHAVQYVRFQALLNHYMSTFRDTEYRYWFESVMRNTGLLVIDDMGKESKALLDVALPAVDAIMRHRVQNVLPTIITTNLDRPTFTTTYAKGVNELVNETCLSYEFIVEQSWRDVEAPTRKQRERALRLVKPLVMG